MKRRQLLGLMGSSVLSASNILAAEHEGMQMGGVSQSPHPDPSFSADVELELVARPTTAALLPGSATQLWQYQGRVVRGDPGTFYILPGGQVPVIRVRTGQRLRIIFTNELPEDTIVHWHGLHIRQKMDGHPMYVIPNGERYVYEFVVENRAGTYWFHPHPHGRTGVQVYRGLSGLFIVDDDESDALGLPAGDRELSWVLQDRRFSADNQLVYAMNHMQMMLGYTGNRMLVNGRLDHVEEVRATSYRVRVMNGSNARFYKLAWSDGRPMTVIGTDGGLLERPIQKPYVMLAPAERAELWLDFSKDIAGTEHVLQSLAYNAGSMGMMRGRMGGGAANANLFDVLKVRVTGPGETPSALPDYFNPLQWPVLEDAVNRDNPRRINLQMGMGRVALNNRVFGMTDVAQDEIVQIDTTEVWEFVNGNAMMPHPMHVHNIQFRVINRFQDNRFRSIHNSLQAGFTDEGWKDVVTVMPGERVQVLLRFNRYTGLYLYHCHILEHEDMGMMRNYQIVASS